VVGGRRRTATLIFNPAFIGSTLPVPTLKMRGVGSTDLNPVRVSNINISDQTNNVGTGTTNSSNGKMDLTGGNVDIMASMITLGLGGTNDDTKGATGTLTFNGGTVDTTGMIVGKKAAANVRSPGTGTVNVSGTGNLVVGSGGIVLASYISGGSGTATGTLNINGGTVTLGGDITDGGGTSAISLSVGTLDMGNHNIGSSTSSIDTLTLASGTLKNVAQINNGGAITKTTAGILTISGVNTFTGPTTVSAGTLLAEGSMLSFVTVNSAATLGGNGTLGDATHLVGMTVLSGGTLAVGDSAGKMTVYAGTNDVTLALGSNDNVEITGNTPGAGGYDQLLVKSGNVSLAGALNVTATYTPGSGDEFWILDNEGSGTLTGAFSNYLTSGSLIGAALPGYQIYYNADYATNSLSGGNDVVLAIPEPATLAMLIIAAGLCLMFKRTRNK
jgi:autotransporter-associated beta strand protein